MKTNFNLEAYTLKRLQPKAEDIELNKCTHNEIDKEGKCALCGTEIDLDLKYEELVHATDTLINYLESMKVIASSTMTRKELKAADQYFNMIPLLNNINTLYDICNERSELLYNVIAEVDSNDESKEFNLEETAGDIDAEVLNRNINLCP